MRRVFLIILTFFAVCELPALVPPVSDIPAKTCLEERGEVYFSFPIPDKHVYHSLMHAISFDYMSDDRVFAYANTQEFDAFLKLGLNYLVHVPPGLQLAEKSYSMRASVNISEIESWDFYPTYEAYEDMMQQFAANFPDLCKLVNIKTLDSERKLLFLKITGNKSTNQVRPRFMYTSAMHGDEPPGFNLMLRLIHHLLNGYGQDESITYLMDKLEIWICPNENPDGTYTNNNNTISGATRSNSNGIDLNRNYPIVVTGDGTNIQPETQAMINLTDSLQFVMSANIHSGIECVNYPYDFWTSNIRKHADHHWWQFVSHEYADTARHYSPSTYMAPVGPSFNHGVTHGGDWYVVSRSRQDYMNYFARQRELTLELSVVKSPPTSTLPALWNYNYRSLINYMHQALYGIHGVVRDAASDKYLTAEIVIPDYDDESSTVVATLPGGAFQRPLLEGAYNVTIKSDGYPVRFYDGLEVRNHETLFLNIDLGTPAFDPAEVVFEPAVVGGYTQKTLIISNTSDESLTVSLDGFSGDPVFLYNVATKSGITIPPQGQESIELGFSPTEPGSYSGELAFTVYLPHQPRVVVPLLANAPAEAALINAVNPILDFGDVSLNQNFTMDISLQNTGNIPLVISDVFITDDAFSLDLSVPYTITAGDLVDVPVVFSPEYAATYSATMSFESNANNENYEITLKGVGIDHTMVNEANDISMSATVFPNPIDVTSSLVWQQDHSGTAFIQLYDIKGQRLISDRVDILVSGKHQLDIGKYTGQLPAGIYYIRVITENTHETIKIFKSNH